MGHCLATLSPLDLQETGTLIAMWRYSDQITWRETC